MRSDEVLVVGDTKEEQDEEEVVAVVAPAVPVEEVGEETKELQVEVEALEEGQDEAVVVAVVVEAEVVKEEVEAEKLTRLTRTFLLVTLFAASLFLCQKWNRFLSSY